MFWIMLKVRWPYFYSKLYLMSMWDKVRLSLFLSKNFDCMEKSFKIPYHFLMYYVMKAMSLIRLLGVLYTVLCPICRPQVMTHIQHKLTSSEKIKLKPQNWLRYFKFTVGACTHWLGSGTNRDKNIKNRYHEKLVSFGKDEQHNMQKMVVGQNFRDEVLKGKIRTDSKVSSCYSCNHH